MWPLVLLTAITEALNAWIANTPEAANSGGGPHTKARTRVASGTATHEFINKKFGSLMICGATKTQAERTTMLIHYV